MVKGKAGARVKISDAPFVSTIHEQEMFDNGDCYRPPKKTIKVRPLKGVQRQEGFT